MLRSISVFLLNTPAQRINNFPSNILNINDSYATYVRHKKQRKSKIEICLPQRQYNKKQSKKISTIRVVTIASRLVARLFTNNCNDTSIRLNL